MTTLGILTEQIQRLYKRASGSNRAEKIVIDKRELRPLILQVANEVLGAKTQGILSFGDLSTPPCTIISFDAIAVTVVNGRSTAPIPVFPLQLPRDMGVWSVVAKTAGNDGVAYIPISTGDWDLLSALDEGLLEGQIGFYVEGKSVFFSAAPTTTVKMKLLVADISTLADTDPFPVSPELEGQIIRGVLDILNGVTIPTTPDITKEEKN